MTPLYRGWSERLRPAWMACWPLATHGVRLIVRRKLFWVLLGLAAMNFLFAFATIYLKAQVSAENPTIGQFVDAVISPSGGQADFFRDFMFAQGTVTMLLLAFAGELLVGGDYRHGGLTFYLSRRIARRHYIMGKLLSISLVVSLTTTIPALILFAEFGLLTDSTEYFQENWRIATGILGYGMLMALVLSLLLLALASWFPRTVPLVMCWACVFVLLPALGALLREIFDDRRWMLLMLWRNLRLIGSWFFGAMRPERDAALLPWAIVVVTAVCVVCLLAVLPRVRAVRVIT